METEGKKNIQNGNAACIISKPVMIYLQEVNIEFEAYSISDNDYGGIKKLLQQVWSFQNLHACLLLSPFLG